MNTSNTNSSGYNAILGKYGIGANDSSANAFPPPRPTVAQPKPQESVKEKPAPQPVSEPKPTIVPEKPPVATFIAKPQGPSQLKAFKKLKEDVEIDDEVEFFEELLEKIKLLNESDVKTMMKDSFNDDDDGNFSFNYNDYNFQISYDSDEDKYNITLSHDDLSEEVEDKFEYDPNSQTPVFFKVLEQKYIDSLKSESKKDLEILQNVEKNLGTKIKHYYSECIDYSENNGEYYLKTESPKNKYICVKDSADENEAIEDFTSMDVSFTNFDPATTGFSTDNDSHHTIEIRNYEISFWRVAKKIIEYIGNEFDKDEKAVEKANDKLREIVNDNSEVRQKIVFDGIRGM